MVFKMPALVYKLTSQSLFKKYESEIMKAALRGTELYFDIAGMQLAPQGNDFIEKPVLFLLHGGPGGDHLRFKQHSLAIENDAQLVFIDHRGCGRSKKTKQADYTLDNNIEDLEALRKHLGLERISILGTSYGGIVAQGYALRYPKCVEKLILVVTAPSYRFINEAKAYLKKHGSAKQIKSAEKLWEGSFKNHQAVLRFFADMETLYSVTHKKNPKLAYSKSHTIWSAEAINEGFGGYLRRYDFTKRLKNLACPTLILAGDKDWICSPAQAKIMAQEIPHSKLHIFKNCGHALAVDAKQKYLKLISQFLQPKKKGAKRRVTAK